MRILGEWDLPGHAGPVYALACNQENQRLFSAGSDGLIAEWRCLTGKQARAIAHIPAAIYALHWIAEKEHLYAGTSTGSVYALDLHHKCLLRAIQAHHSAVFGIFSHPTEKEGWTSGKDGQFLFWDTEKAEPFAAISVTEAGLRGFARLHARDTFLGAGRDGFVYEIDRKRRTVLRQVSADPHFVFAVQVAPNAAHIATGGKSGFLKIWNTDLSLIWDAPAHQLTLNAIAWHPGGQIVATGGRDRLIHLWDLQTREKKLTLTGHQRSVNALLWIEEDVLASAGDDGLIKIWHLEGLPA